MNVSGAVVFVIIFISTFRFLRILENSQFVVHVARKAMRDMMNSDLGDDEKEVLVRGHALSFLKYFFILSLSAIVAMVFPTGAIWVLDFLGLMSFDAVFSILLSSWFLVSSTAILFIYFYITSRKKT